MKEEQIKKYLDKAWEGAPAGMKDLAKVRV